ncbi:MAG: GNAT family N-acetyltransferase [Bacillota bacterium]
MSEIQRDLSPGGLAQAIHRGFVEHVLAIARVVPGWQLEQVGPFTLIYHQQGPTPLDGVLEARLEPATAEGEIRALLDRFRSMGRSLLWMATGPDRLPDLAQRLTALGFAPDDPLPAMALDLERLDGTEPLPDGLRIEPVRDQASHGALMQIQVQTLGEGFGPRAALKAAFGLNEDGPVQHCLGYLEGRPVAGATTVYFGGLATLYGIGTLPEARGRGIGRAMTIQACREARRRGYRVAALFATPSGLPVYQRLGFQAYDQFQMFFHPHR